MGSKLPNVAISIVTYNSARTIRPCLEAALNQEWPWASGGIGIVVLDNCSSDGTADIVAELGGAVELLRNTENTGFAGGQNRAITHALRFGADAVFLLNPDLKLAPDAVSKLVAVLVADTRAGSLCPKLLRADESLQPVTPRALDSSGMFMTPSLRHLDRGSQHLDDGSFDKDEYVFGGSGAALLLRRDCILDVAFPGQEGEDLQVFDPYFHSYREDADFAWRALRLGWKCRYVPSAIGYHERRVLPERRGSLPAELNAYSVRNRFLLQFNNFSWNANASCILPGMWRNLLVVAAAATIERSSWSAVVQAARLAPQCFRRRSRSRKPRVPSWEIAKWFRHEPYAEPALPVEAPGAKVSSVTAVVINYNSGDRLEACIRALLDAKQHVSESVDLRISVIDNASVDGSAQQVADNLCAEPFYLERSPSNLGFAGGVNRGVAAVRDSDAILVLNPDVIVSGDSIIRLAGALERHAALGAVAPLLKDREGTVQRDYTVKQFPTLGSTLAELFFLHRLWPGNPWTAALRMDTPFVASYLRGEHGPQGMPFEAPELPLLVPQPAAACLLIRSEAFKQLSGFDTSFWPAWYEDVDFCMRLERIGLRCAVIADAHAVHEGGYSLNSLARHQFLAMYYGNLLHLWKKHGSKLQYFLLRALLPLALVLRSLITFSQAALHAGKADARWETPKALFRLAFGFGKREH